MLNQKDKGMDPVHETEMQMKEGRWTLTERGVKNKRNKMAGSKGKNGYAERGEKVERKISEENCG